MRNRGGGCEQTFSVADLLIFGWVVKKGDPELTPAEKKRAADRAYRERLKSDPVRYARYREKIKRWQKANPEAYKRAKQRWEARNPTYNSEWHERHPDYYPRYRAKRREELAAYGREWRAKKKASQPSKPCLGCGVQTQCPKYCTVACSRNHRRRKP